MTKPTTFLIAILYGASWFAGPVNLLAAVTALGEGESPFAYLSTILLSFGIILLVHKRLGWFPFHRRS